MIIPRRSVPAAFWLSLAFLLSACEETSAYRTPTATLNPAFVATSQSAEAAAQATQAYGRGMMAEIDVTAEALAVEREIISLEMTQAAATAEAAVQQTAESQAATATANAALAAATAAQATATRQAFFDAGTATQQAYEISGTATQQSIQATGTATAEMAIQAVRATETESALLILRAEAQAEAQRIQDEQASQNLRTWLWRIFWASVAVSAFVLVFVTLVQFRRAILSRMMLVRFGPKGRGKPYFLGLQSDGSAKWIDLSKSSGAVIDVPASGEAQVQGLSSDPQMQSQLAMQAALTELLLALNTVTREHRLPWEQEQSSNQAELRKARSAAATALLQRAAQQQALSSGQQAGVRYLPPEIQTIKFRTARPEDRDVAGWMDEVQGKLLDE